MNMSKRGKLQASIKERFTTMQNVTMTETNRLEAFCDRVNANDVGNPARSYRLVNLACTCLHKLDMTFEEIKRFHNSGVMTLDQIL